MCVVFHRAYRSVQPFPNAVKAIQCTVQAIPTMFKKAFTVVPR